MKTLSLMILKFRRVVLDWLNSKGKTRNITDRVLKSSDISLTLYFIY
jgi:hypothetical protein